MRAIRVSQNGGPEVLQIADTADPAIGPGQVLVETQAIGVNYIDTYFRTGAYPREVPYIPGSEGTGVVIDVGADVSDIAVGDRVAWAAANDSYAEKVAVDADKAVPVPAGVEPPEAASALLQGMTAHYLIESVYKPEQGDTVLVHAGAGGVGLVLTQLLAARGIRVIRCRRFPTTCIGCRVSCSAIQTSAHSASPVVPTSDCRALARPH